MIFKKLLSVFLFCLVTFSYGQINFDPPLNIVDDSHSSFRVNAVVAADLNNDSFDDLIVASIIDNSIKIYRSFNGDFHEEQRLQLVKLFNVSFYAKYSLAVSDFNSDGLNDVVISSSFEDKVFWIQNLGNFTFSQPISITNNIDDPISTIAVDIDNDGDDDVLVSTGRSEKISLFQNNNGVFSSETLIHSSNRDIIKLFNLDVDQNGFLDIFFLEENGTLGYMLNLNGVLSNPTIVSSSVNSSGVAFSDINNDGYKDIIYSHDFYDTLRYHSYIPGQGYSQSSVQLSSSLIIPNNIIIYDIDGDQLDDIIFSSPWTDEIGWLKRDSNNGFLPYIVIAGNFENPNALILSDLNNDGKKEIVYGAEKKCSALYIDPQGSVLKENVINYLFTFSRSIIPVDLTNNGLKDLVIGYNSLLWVENKGGGLYSAPRAFSNNTDSSFEYATATADFDNDGFKDIITATDSEVRIFKNNTDKTFTELYSQTQTQTVRDIAVADMNNDGFNDVLIATADSNSPLELYLSNGNYTFQPKIVINSSFSNFEPTIIEVHDLDSDGDLDIVCASNFTNAIHKITNNGLPNPFSVSLIISNTDAAVLAMADHDGDGDLDILTGSDYAAVNSDILLLTNNNGTFSNPSVFDSQSVDGLSYADINNDGFLDIVAVSCTSFSGLREDAFYYLNDGNSNYNKTYIQQLSNSNTWNKTLALSDMNNDGKVDILTNFQTDVFNNYETKYAVKIFTNDNVLSTDMQAENNNFKIYPNPAAEEIRWNENLNYDFDISVFSISGELVKKSKCNVQHFDTSDLEEGIYLIKFIYSDLIFTKKIVIKR